jgi:acetoin utilization deacetylase AcuC-like enzyme
MTSSTSSVSSPSSNSGNSANSGMSGAGARRLVLVDDPAFGLHRAPSGHPERPERLDAVRAGAARADSGMRQRELSARPASEDELARVHDATYIEQLGHLAGKSGYLDADTYFGPRSVEAARVAAGAAVVLSDALIARDAECGVALVRPPGHHARPSRAMGFCLLNNVAVAAAHARARGVERVAIVDFDVHHGNGTQECFYQDPSVLYVSLHQWPHYPGTGAVDECGRGEGLGYTVNVPLSAGAGDATYVAAVERIVAPVLELYRPGLLLVSAGYDAHARDPLAQMSLSADGYAAMVSGLLRALEPTVGVGLVLEGGYDLIGLSESMAATLQALGGASPVAPGDRLSDAHERDLAASIRSASNFWRL